MQTDLDIIIENSITDSTETSTLHQAFTNCVHGYDHVHGYDRVYNVHANSCTVLIRLCKNDLNLPIFSSFFLPCA